MFRVEVLQTRGTPYEVGFRQGVEFLRTGRGQRYASSSTSTGARTFSLSSAENAFSRYAPNIWEEFLGLADGVQKPIEDIVRQWGNYTLQYPRTGCSTIVADGIYARNYDFQARLYEPRFALVQPVGVYASAGFSHFIIGRVDGMNEKGLVCGLHMVSFQRPGPGFIATLIVRMVLDQCACVDEAVDLLKRLPHGLSYNYSLADAGGNGAVVEATPRTVGVRKGPQLACTNHFQTPLLRPVNPKNVSHSRSRVAPLEARLHASAAATGVSREHEATKLYAFLNASNSPAFHHGYTKGAGTLHTVVCIPELVRMLVGVGGDGPPTIFDLAKWVNGSSIIPDNIEGQLGGSTKPFNPVKRALAGRGGAKRHASANKTGDIFDGHDFRGARLSRINLSDCRLENSNLNGIDIAETCDVKAMKIYGVSVEDLFRAYEELQEKNPYRLPRSHD